MLNTASILFLLTHVGLNIFNSHQTLLNYLKIMIQKLSQANYTSELRENVMVSLVCSVETNSVTDINFIAYLFITQDIY